MLELPFTSSDFHETWAEYLLLREEKKKPYKNNRSMEMGLKKLFRLSRGDEEIAIAILEESISERWQGFFGLKRSDPLMIKLNDKSKTVKRDASDILLEKYGFNK